MIYIMEESTNYFILFLLYLIINSDVFVNNVLSSINGTVNVDKVTTLGALLQAFTLVLLYVAYTCV